MFAGFLMSTKFQKGIISEKLYSGRELRDIILELFPAGQQAIREGSVLQDVHFKGLAFIQKSQDYKPDFYELYHLMQLSSDSREEILRMRIPDILPVNEDSWIKIIELEPDPDQFSTTTVTRFGYVVNRDCLTG